MKKSTPEYISKLGIGRSIFRAQPWYMHAADLFSYLLLALPLKLPPDILIIKVRGIGIVYNPNIMILQEAEEPSTRAQANLGSG